MRVIQLKLSTMEDVKNFIGAAADYNVNIELLKPVDLIICEKDEKIMDAVVNDMKNWVVSETETKSDLEESGKMKVGDKVKILASAEKYVTGEIIPARLKGETDEVMQMGKDGKSVLLKKIYSWVWMKDVEIVESGCECAPAPGMKVGDKVKILASAEKYVTGEIIPERLKGETDEVMQMGKDGKSVLLKKIYSWVWMKDVEIVK